MGILFTILGVALLGFVVGFIAGAAFGVHQEQGRWAPTTPMLTYSDEPRVHVTRGPYDHEAGGDFDA